MDGHWVDKLESKLGWLAVPGLPTAAQLGHMALASAVLKAVNSSLYGLAGRVQNGLVPSDFPEDGSPPRHSAADTSFMDSNEV